MGSNLLFKSVALGKTIIPKNLVLPILSGALAGKKWYVNCSALAYWFGTVENEYMYKIKSILEPGDIFYDIGANAGIYSLYCSEILKRGKVIAFEPLSGNVSVFKKHMKLNKCNNVTIYDIALSDKNGTAHFDGYDLDNTMGHLSNSGIPVKERSIDSLINTDKLPIPNVMKIDVEGSECDVLTGAIQTLKTNNIKLLISIHNQTARQGCITLLKNINYKLESLDGVDYNDAGNIYSYR